MMLPVWPKCLLSHYPVHLHVPGIHCSVSLMACSVMKQSIVLVSSLIVTLLNLPLSKASSTDFASEKTTMSYLAFIPSVKCLEMLHSEASIAFASAS